MKIDNSSFERVDQFGYLETTLTNENYIKGKTKSRLKLGNALLPLGAEPFVFQSAVQTYKHQDIQNYNFACCFVWV